MAEQDDLAAEVSRAMEIDVELDLCRASDQARMETWLSERYGMVTVVLTPRHCTVSVLQTIDLTDGAGRMIDRWTFAHRDGPHYRGVALGRAVVAARAKLDVGGPR